MLNNLLTSHLKSFILLRENSPLLDQSPKSSLELNNPLHSLNFAMTFLTTSFAFLLDGTLHWRRLLFTVRITAISNYASFKCWWIWISNAVQALKMRSWNAFETGSKIMASTGNYTRGCLYWPIFLYLSQRSNLDKIYTVSPSPTLSQSISLQSFFILSHCFLSSTTG